MRLLNWADRREPCFYVVVPAHGVSRQMISPCAMRLIHYLKTRAEIFAPKHTQILLVDNNSRLALRLSDGKCVRPDHLDRSELRAVVNPSFLLQDIPPFRELLDQAERQQIAVCASPDAHDCYGFAWRKNAISAEQIWDVLCVLTATSAECRPHSLSRNLINNPVPPSCSSAFHSPTLDGIENKHGRRFGDAPIYVNTAFDELLAHQHHREVDWADDVRHAANTLVNHRKNSQVPWIFNALINEIEYRQGVLEPNSLPPEIHLSLTGACNLECRFCAYTNDNAIYKFSDLRKIEQLDFLRHVQILRLSSGLGEPTLNKHLPEVINYLAANFPQLTLNFFTNAVALHRPGLIEALVNQARWINVSLNASNAQSWQIQHQENHFDRVCGNLKKLRDAKRQAGSIFPLVFSSMVLNGKNIHDLPRMPALCRTLGIDRLTGFPYSALGYHTVPHTFGPEETLENFRAEYDEIYEETVQQAAAHRVSLEIPSPLARKTVRYGLEVRGFYDFANIEKNEWQLGKLADAFLESRAGGDLCGFLWRMGCIGSTHKGSRAQHASNYMYPCIGPLSSAELSQATTFNFPNEAEFSELWKNPVFKHLRRAQTQRGVCGVCDKCRCSDSRDAETFPDFERLVAEFTSEMDSLMSVIQPSATDQTSPKIISLRAMESR